MSQLRDFGCILRLMAKASPLAAAGVAALLAALSALPALELWALQGLIDALTIARAAARPVGWGIALVGLALLAETAKRGLDYLQRRLQSDGERVLTEQLLAAAGAQPLAGFETPAYFDRLDRAQRGIKHSLGPDLDLTVTIIKQGGGMIALFVALFRIHPAATLLYMGVGLPVWLINTLVSRSHTYVYRAQTERERRATYLADVLTEHRVAPEIRLTGLSDRLLERRDGIVAGLVGERLHLVLVRLAAQTTTYSIGALAFAGALILLGRSTLGGQLTLGRFAVAIRAAQSMQSGTVDALWSINLLLFGTAFAPDYWAALATPGDSAPSVASPAPAFAVRMDGVGFNYPGTARPALTDISFAVRPGELIALVGENGAGKSTLVKLLLGLYTPTSGTVTVAGVAPDRREAWTVRAKLAPVFQDFQRYALTAGENIGVGDVAAIDDLERIATAAAGAEAATTIAALPDGYGTLLGREFAGGHELSGGQWQRLAVARAYMRDAALIALDEPTAALDPQAEVDVFRRFRGLSAGRTAFLVSHRLGAARFADRIIVLKDGRIIEQGNHDDLVALNGEYASMFAAQAQWYR